MSLQANGKIIEVKPPMTGTSKSSGKSWIIQEAMLETSGEHPRKIAFELFGVNVEKYHLIVGDEVTIHFDIDSREYQGRWYTKIKAWKVESSTTAAPQPAVSAPTPQPTGTPPPPQQNGTLPF